MKLLGTKIYLVPTKGSRRAFSLVELLVVISILILITGLTTGGLRGLAEGSHLDKALVGISGAMENARQAAIAGGTYTWVGLNSEKDPKTGQNTITVVTFASRDGTRGAGALPLRTVLKPEKFDSVTLENEIPSGNRLNDADQIPKIKNSLYADKGSFRPTSNDVRSDLRGLNFNWVVVFTPRGNACIDNAVPMTGSDGAVADDLSPAEAVRMVVSSCKGDRPSTVEGKSASVVQVNGITGQVDVFQPQP